MLNNKTIAVVIPAYNEEKQITEVINGLPDYIDRIVVVNDGSSDQTENVVINLIHADNKTTLSIAKPEPVKPTRFNYADILLQEDQERELFFLPKFEVKNAYTEHNRIILLSLLKNSGVGSAVACGYKWCKDYNIDCIVKIDGDGQMDPGEIYTVCLPVINGEVDYVKGNRLIHKSSRVVIPRVRFMGNSILSILTKIASGYWHISDTQTAFTAISLDALKSIDLVKLYKKYGYPNDMLVKLNIAYRSVREVGIKPIYEVGENSKMKIFKVIPRISWLLFKSFFKRIWIKYLLRNFHPLFILYNLGFVLLFITIPYGIKLLKISLAGEQANPLTALAFAFAFISGFQSILFAMWMDIQDNERLNK
jgi:glycosyltransferase involved in cell wall biosynthesis